MGIPLQLPHKYTYSAYALTYHNISQVCRQRICIGHKYPTKCIHSMATCTHANMQANTGPQLLSLK